MPMPERIETRVVRSNQLTGLIVHTLMLKSVWFQVEPLPDDRYEITVKAEHADLLDDTWLKARTLINY
jgi:hypothetical protein